MKKIITVFTFLLAILPDAESQNSFPTNGTALLNSSNDRALIIKDSRAGNNWNYIEWQFDNGTRDWVMGRRGTFGYFTLWRAGINEVLTVDNSGNLGIGTTVPQARLEIRSSGSQAELKVRHQNELETLWGLSIKQLENLSGMISCGGRDLQIESGWDKSLILGNAFYNNSGGKVLIPGGNVGIGTSSPDAKLTVKGKIHAEEVRVDLNVPGPDYVFEKEYNLLSLTDLEEYINLYKHLPEVPSAKEMEEHGLNLKEMNLLLLKKVEELTLHLIEANKSIMQLQQEVKDMQKH
jgi:hypothetical protein